MTDSLQSIGGGGSSYGTNPMLVAQQRLQAATDAQTKLLDIIARNTAVSGLE